MNKIIIDRFEGEYAVCENEDNTFTSIPICTLPPTIKEGDFLIQLEDGTFQMEDGTYQIDESSTEARKKRIQEKMNGLFE